MTSRKGFLEENNCWPVKKTAIGNTAKLLLGKITKNTDGNSPVSTRTNASNDVKDHFPVCLSVHCAYRN